MRKLPANTITVSKPNEYHAFSLLRNPVISGVQHVMGNSVNKAVTLSLGRIAFKSAKMATPLLKIFPNYFRKTHLKNNII
jgi:hypothetical protein